MKSCYDRDLEKLDNKKPHRLIEDDIIANNDMKELDQKKLKGGKENVRK